MKKLRIGIIGCGAIGSSLAKAIRRDFKGSAVLAALYDLDRSKIGIPAAKSREGLIKKSDLVIEASSSEFSFEIAKEVLGEGKDVIIMSVGGISGKLKELTRIAKEYGGRAYIPSGAISGVDALKAAKIAGIKKVTLTTRKHPFSFKGVEYINKRGIRLDKIKKDKVLFFGPAYLAVRYFPQNINVAGVLGLAGIGAQKTMVKIIASPGTKKNIHELKIDSAAAKIKTRTENTLHPDNPKTSYLAVLSAIAALRQILEPVRIGT